jgi:hypothetical protein
MLQYGRWKLGIILSEGHGIQVSDDEQLLPIKTQQAPNLSQAYREASTT